MNKVCLTDSERIDWLEEFIRTEGEVHLHDGHHPRGIGLSTRNRGLRQAIDDAYSAENRTPKRLVDEAAKGKP